MSLRPAAAIRRTSIDWLNAAQDSEIFLLARIVEADEDGVPLSLLESGDVQRDLSRSRDLLVLQSADLVTISDDRRAMRTADGAAIMFAFIAQRRAEA